MYIYTVKTGSDIQTSESTVIVDGVVEVDKIYQANSKVNDLVIVAVPKRDTAMT